jgi:hypothetical protein
MTKQERDDLASPTEPLSINGSAILSPKPAGSYLTIPRLKGNRDQALSPLFSFGREWLQNGCHGVQSSALVWLNPRNRMATVQTVSETRPFVQD